jgi:hypothetical protein
MQSMCYMHLGFLTPVRTHCEKRVRSSRVIRVGRSLFTSVYPSGYRRDFRILSEMSDQVVVRTHHERPWLR